MESRKYQLQQQILEALKAKDNDLYSLLKSQWAHRFGVESLEELQKLDMTLLNQKTINVDSSTNDQSRDNCLEVEKENSIKDNDNQEKEITNEIKNVVESAKLDNKESFEIKSYELVDKKSHENKIINTIREDKIPPKVEALIPLPPKPKYSYLNKWLMKN